jgi:two-component system capsular synthesis sensor histidine kinase RcsC
MAKVLVIEDNEINREMFCRYLAFMGHKPVPASNGNEGVRILDGELFGLVITDLSMPGLSGWQVAERVKKQSPGVPVILVSGWAIQQDDARIREAGVDFVLQKPCSLSIFQEVVEKALSSIDREEAESTTAKEAEEAAGT